MKAALLADAHANLPAVDAVLRDIARQGVDLIIFAGDAAGYYPYINEVCSLIRRHAALAVKGNHDAFITGRLAVPEEKRKAYALDYSLNEISGENREWLTALPESLEYELSGSFIRVFHGSPWDHLREYIYPDYGYFERFGLIEADFIILGHTHHPMVKRIGDTLIINPGSCGQPRDYNPAASYAILDVGRREAEIRRVVYETDTILQKTGELGFDDEARSILTRMTNNRKNRMDLISDKAGEATLADSGEQS